MFRPNRSGLMPYRNTRPRLRVQEIAARTGMALTILRLATLYGEGDPRNIKRLIRTLDQGRFIWIGDGRNQKSLLYVRDAARACSMVALRPRVWYSGVQRLRAPLHHARDCGYSG